MARKRVRVREWKRERERESAPNERPNRFNLVRSDHRVLCKSILWLATVFNKHDDLEIDLSSSVLITLISPKNTKVGCDTVA